MQFLYSCYSTNNLIDILIYFILPACMLYQYSWASCMISFFNLKLWRIHNKPQKHKLSSSLMLKSIRWPFLTCSKITWNFGSCVYASLIFRIIKCWTCRIARIIFNSFIWKAIFQSLITSSNFHSLTIKLAKVPTNFRLREPATTLAFLGW